MADVAMEEEVIETHERELIHSIIGFGDTDRARGHGARAPTCGPSRPTCRCPRPWTWPSKPGFSRLPVHEGNLDDVVGIAFAKDLIRAEREGHGERARARLRAAPPTSSPRPNACRASCGRCRSASSTWPSSSTSTAARPGWSPSRTSSRNWWGRSSTSTTSRSLPCRPSADGEVSVTARLAVDELNELLDAELPDGRLGHRRGPAVQRARAASPSRVSRSRSTACASWPSGSRATASAASASSPLHRRRPVGHSPTDHDDPEPRQ